MAKIILKNKGITLVEILIYMSIFSIICFMISSSVFYLQKIIQNNNQNYYFKNQIYFNLNILQQYLYKNRVQLVNGELSFFDKNDNRILLQKIENKQIKNVYQNKYFIIDDYLNFQEYKISIIDKGNVLKFEISWLDNNRRLKNLTEYLIVINQNL